MRTEQLIPVGEGSGEPWQLVWDEHTLTLTDARGHVVLNSPTISFGMIQDAHDFLVDHHIRFATRERRWLFEANSAATTGLLPLVAPVFAHGLVAQEGWMPDESRRVVLLAASIIATFGAVAEAARAHGGFKVLVTLCGCLFALAAGRCLLGVLGTRRRLRRLRVVRKELGDVNAWLAKLPENFGEFIGPCGFANSIELSSR